MIESGFVFTSQTQKRIHFSDLQTHKNFIPRTERAGFVLFIILPVPENFAMILLTSAPKDCILHPLQDSLQRHKDAATTKKLSAPIARETDDENDYCMLDVPNVALMQKNVNSDRFQSDKNKKSVRFHDVVETCTLMEEPITTEEKGMAWYTHRKIETIRNNTRLYAKFLVSIDSEAMDSLLNTELYDFMDEEYDGSSIQDEIICLRGLEKYVPNKLSSALLSSSSVRRKILIELVIVEQSIQTNDHGVIHSPDRIREASVSISKKCSAFPYQIAQKSYCFIAKAA